MSVPPRAPAPAPAPASAPASAPAAPEAASARPPVPPAAAPAATPPPFVHMHIDPDEYARRFPLAAMQHGSAASHATRTFLFALLWVAAFAFGALGARWVDDNGGMQAAWHKLMPAPGGRAEVPVAAAPDRSELPYDGHSEGNSGSRGNSSNSSVGANTDAGQPLLHATQDIERPPVREVNPPVSGGKTAAVRSTPPDVATKEAPPGTSSGANTASTESDTSAEAAPAPPKASKPVEKPAAQQPAKAAKPAKKPSTTTQKIARGREISRIQQQAADELKKKTRKRRGAVEHAKKATKASLYASPAPRRMRKLLARCDKLDGIFWREQCKWRLCDGQWGRNGCPAYTRDKLAVD